MLLIHSILFMANRGLYMTMLMLVIFQWLHKATSIHLKQSMAKTLFLMVSWQDRSVGHHYHTWSRLSKPLKQMQEIWDTSWLVSSHRHWCAHPIQALWSTQCIWSAAHFWVWGNPTLPMWVFCPYVLSSLLTNAHGQLHQHSICFWWTLWHPGCPQKSQGYHPTAVAHDYNANPDSRCHRW